VSDTGSEAQADQPTPEVGPRRRYPPAPRPGLRAPRAARPAQPRAAAPNRSRTAVRAGRPERSALSASALGEDAQDDSPSLVGMVGIVALSVALIILVSFAAGYGFGHLFL